MLSGIYKMIFHVSLAYTANLGNQMPHRHDLCAPAIFRSVDLTNNANSSTCTVKKKKRKKNKKEKGCQTYILWKSLK